MTERPILFSGPMIRAILASQKTQTRRVVGLDTLRPSTTSGYDWTFRGKAPVRSIAQQKRAAGGCWQDLTAGQFLALCPYGQPGDRLWVRETFASFDAPDGSDRTLVAYRATCQNDRLTFIGDATAGGSFAVQEIEVHRWRPSIYMPRWASRLTLEVTSVRVERLHDITEADARAEGVEASNGAAPSGWARHNFADLWESINGPASWEADPFVWVVGFKRVEVRHG